MSMIEVSKEQFFKVVGPMNVGPRSEREYTEWASITTRQVIGRSSPGYINNGIKPGRYWLEESLIARAP